ncbi:MAG: hypothetical protein J6F30_11790 [Cellulosilyticum sp.]|nr:hypothetical protein [Cellulosilyticum sp.]
MKQKKYTLLIDQDDVLAEYIQGVTKAYNEKYNTCISASECVSWNLYQVFGTEVDTVMHEPELFKKLEPVKNAIEVFERLYKSELFEMYIVTAANPTCVPAKVEWLKKYLPFFPVDRVIFCQRKYMIKGDFLLDDGMHNIEEFQKAGGTPIIFERPHNEFKGKGILRVKDWLSFEKLIMQICYPKQVEEDVTETAI